MRWRMKVTPRGLKERCKVEDPGAKEDTAERAASPFFLLLGYHSPSIMGYALLQFLPVSVHFSD